MTTDRCRMCGGKENLKHALQGGQELLKKLRLCANISIDFEGVLPTHICLKCEQGLNFSYQLRKQGEAMELRLRQELMSKAGMLDLSNEVDDIEDELQEFRVENLKQKNDKQSDDDVEIIEIAENGKSRKVLGNNKAVLEQRDVAARVLEKFTAFRAKQAGTQLLVRPALNMPSRVNAAVGNCNKVIAPSYNAAVESSNNVTTPVYNPKNGNTDIAIAPVYNAEAGNSNNANHASVYNQKVGTSNFVMAPVYITAAGNSNNAMAPVYTAAAGNSNIIIAQVYNQSFGNSNNALAPVGNSNFENSINVITPVYNAAVENSTNVVTPVYSPAVRNNNNMAPVYIEPSCANRAVNDNLTETGELVAPIFKNRPCKISAVPVNYLGNRDLIVRPVNQNSPCTNATIIERRIGNCDLVVTPIHKNTTYANPLNSQNHNTNCNTFVAPVNALISQAQTTNCHTFAALAREDMAIAYSNYKVIEEPPPGIIAHYGPIKSMAAESSALISQTAKLNSHTKAVANYISKADIINEDDDVQIIAEFSPLTGDLEKETPEADASDIEFVDETSSSVSESIVCKNSNLDCEPHRDKSLIQKDELDIMEQFAVRDEGAANTAATGITQDIIGDDIIEECTDVDDESSVVYEENFEFETLEKYSIDLIDEVQVDDSEDDSESLKESAKVDGSIQFGQTNDNLEKQLYKCETCSESFPNQTHYRDHIKAHGRERFNCIQCSKWFPTRYRLQQHERIHSDDVDFHQCSFCKNSYRHRQNLLRHMRCAHSTENTFQCSECNEIFTRPDILKNHMTKHTNERNFICDICSKGFKSSLYLQSHRKTHVIKANTEYQEQVKPPSHLERRHSSTSFTSQTSHTSNSKDTSDATHDITSKRSYYCMHCGKISKHHFAHKNHLRTHTNERPYKCFECPKMFRTMAAKITHERIHSDERPYQCERCLISFRQPSHLKEHKLIHDGIMSYVCSVCNMAFTKKSNMKVHMRIHTGERPYKCAENTCGQQFAKLAQLKRHAVQAHARDVDVTAGDEEDEAENEEQGNDEETSDDETEIEEFNREDDLHVGSGMEENCLGGIIASDDLDLGIAIGAEETATELVVGDDAQYNSLYILDDMMSS